jgi:hypothetical protein
MVQQNDIMPIITGCCSAHDSKPELCRKVVTPCFSEAPDSQVLLQLLESSGVSDLGPPVRERVRSIQKCDASSLLVGFGT